MLVDTGGIETVTDDVILKQMRRQAELAIERADVIVLVTDVRCGVTADDSAVASMLQKSGKPVVLAVNKCDSIGEPPMELYEFYNLGIGDPFPISAAHGHGTGDMLDAVYDLLPPEDQLEDDEDAIHVAIIGKPNVGKSSLVNRIAGEERAIVSNVAGTTRDATDTTVENEDGKFVLIDTAGIRKKSPRYRANRTLQCAACLYGGRPCGRVPDSDRCHRGLHGTGFQGCRLCPRTGQGFHYRGQQVGSD